MSFIKYKNLLQNKLFEFQNTLQIFFIDFILPENISCLNDIYFIWRSVSDKFHIGKLLQGLKFSASLKNMNENFEVHIKIQVTSR